MEIPKRILSLIKDIENTGKRLSRLESDLYDWLENNDLDTDSNNSMWNNNNLDASLELLFRSGDGTNLINQLKKIERK